MYSTDHIILRDIPADGNVRHRLERKPVRVATMLDESKFMELGNHLRHNDTVFLEDRMHDWDYSPVNREEPNGLGDFRYYTRVAMRADVLVVFELTKTPPESAIKFDPKTGEPVVAT